MSFRYGSEDARQLTADLAEIKEAKKQPSRVSHGGLTRISKGETALGSMDGERSYHAANTSNEIKKHELKVKLEGLLNKSKAKTASARLDLGVSMLRLKQAADMPESAEPEITPDKMTNDEGGAAAREPASAPEARPGSRQGPVADLFAAQLRALKEQHRTVI